jgi:hypothetical protein
MSNQSSTRAQKLFLQAFRDDPAGPLPAKWPSPAILQRWLENEDFRTALNQYRDTMRFQSDFHLTAAANAAAKSIHSTITPSSDPAAPQPDLSKKLKSLTDLLRLAHIRQRFTAESPTRDVAEEKTSKNPSNQHTPQPGITWTDQPHIIADIFCDPDKGRLKEYMLFLTMHGYKGYEPFLAAFPEDLKEAQESAAEYAEHVPATPIQRPLDCDAPADQSSLANH